MPDVSPRFKDTVEAPWSKADGYAAVDRRSGGFCECNGAGEPSCGLRANVRHHVAGRGGPDPHRPDNLLHLNDAHHRAIHANPVDSYERGVMRRRNAIKPWEGID